MINVLLPSIQDVQNGVIIAIRTLLLHLCEPVYKLIVFCFQIFEGFGKLRLFENSDVIAQIYNRIGLILGLFMIFRITFSAIEYIINPDNIFDKEKGIGNIVKRVLIVIVLLGSTRFLFDEAYDIQDKLIDSQIVSKLLLTDPTISYEDNGGAIIAWTAFNTFYRINPEASGDERDTCAEMMDENGVIYENFFESEGNLLDSAGYCLNAVDESETNVIIFNGVFCLGVGAFLLWTIFTYTVQAGVRVLQLAYLELIAPVPIMMYLTPDGDSKLKNWGQQCLTTFLDFFIRVAIMDFIIIVSGTLIDMQSNILGYFGDIQMSNGNLAEMYVILIMIIALMIFAKRIPNLLKEILPSTGGTASLGFGFGLTGETKKVGGFLGGFAGATVGGLANGVVSGIDRANIAGTLGRNRLGAFGAGLLGGGAIGIKNGAKGGNVFKNLSAGWTARNKADRQYEKLIASGGSATGVALAKFRSNFGETPGEYLTRQMEHADKINEHQKKFFEYINNLGDVRMWSDAAKEATIKEGESVEAFTARKRMYEENAQNAREAASRAVEEGRSMDDIKTNGLSYDIKELKEKTRMVKGADGVFKPEKYLDEVTTKRNFNILKDDDKHYSGASAEVAEANSYITSRHVKVDDGSGFNDMATIGSGKGQQSFKEAGKAANESKKNISKSVKYQREKANNEGAGISK